MGPIIQTLLPGTLAKFVECHHKYASNSFQWPTFPLQLQICYTLPSMSWQKRYLHEGLSLSRPTKRTTDKDYLYRRTLDLSSCCCLSTQIVFDICSCFLRVHSCFKNLPWICSLNSSGQSVSVRIDYLWNNCLLCSFLIFRTLKRWPAIL